MFENYFRTAWRNLAKNKFSSFINIGGLAAGMAVALLISLWIYDELSFNKYHENYSSIVEVMANSNMADGVATQSVLPVPLSAVLKNKYGSDIKYAASVVTTEQGIAFNDNAFWKTGCYAEPDFTSIITLQMLEGTKAALQNSGSVLLNASTAKAIFGNSEPMNKIITLNGGTAFKVAGVYKDMPQNTRFADVNFIAPVASLYKNSSDMNDDWYNSSFQIYALLNPAGNAPSISSKIKNVLFEHTKDAIKPSLFLYPMQQWHLYEFKSGHLVAGRLQFVWMFGIIGAFVLLLACINFMNLSTAHSEKRAKEVGIRKAIGSLRGQLIKQFFSESFLVTIVAFLISIILTLLTLSWFNELSGKQIKIVWNNPFVWLAAFAFCMLTAVLAGCYPAFFLSSFKPVKVLKGTFKAGRFATLPRKILVVVQFTVSIVLIIGTIIVFKQIKFAKDRPIGYNRNNLIIIPYTESMAKQYNAFRDELLQTNVITGISASSSPTTGVWSSADNLDWKGKDPDRQQLFGTILVDPGFGNVINWQMKEGRNFSAQFLTDSSGFLFNETAIKQMGLKNPLGETIKWHGRDWKILGVVKDMVMTSPFDPAVPTVFLMDNKERSFNVVNLKINVAVPVQQALAKIETVYKKFTPGSPFDYKFADYEYALKYAAEERVGKLAMFFTILAIFISCLGLFGMASFVAEQRTKEIGIRKVVGASVFSVWTMLSKDFVVMVLISFLIAAPIAYYFMHNWLQNYTYRTQLSWWIFVAAGVGALMITLLTVSFQSINAAIANPVKSLRTE